MEPLTLPEASPMLGPPKVRDLARPLLVSLEPLVPKDNIYRHLDQALDLSFVRDWVKECYADIGRPSIDPVVFFRLQLVLYLEGLRSERQLMRLAADRLSVRWYIGYGFDETLPDHSTLTRIRERYGLEIFRRFFDTVVEQCVKANASRHDWIAEGGEQERDVQHGSYRRVADFQMSTTDADATLMRARRGGALQLGYHDHYLTDGGRDRIILSVLVTPSEVMENQVMLDLVWHTCFRWQLWPDQVAADTTYGTIENIIPIDDSGIAMYTPLPDWDGRSLYFGASLFTYDPETDTYRCPDAKTLRRDHAKYTEGKIVYQAAPGVCSACALKSQCTSSKEGRRIHRNIDEDYLDRVRAHHQTEAYEKAMRKRKLWTEPLFAEAKLWHGMRRFRLRRLWRVNIEALMVATAQNLKRLLTWQGRRYPPASGMAVPTPSRSEYVPLTVGFIARIAVDVPGDGAAARFPGRDVPSDHPDRDFINTLSGLSVPAASNVTLVVALGQWIALGQEAPLGVEESASRRPFSPGRPTAVCGSR
jgi:transposase